MIITVVYAWLVFGPRHPTIDRPKKMGPYTIESCSERAIFLMKIDPTIYAACFERPRR